MEGETGWQQRCYLPRGRNRWTFLLDGTRNAGPGRPTPSRRKEPENLGGSSLCSDRAKPGQKGQSRGGMEQSEARHEKQSCGTLAERDKNRAVRMGEP